MKHTIWTNNLDYKDWKDDLTNEYPSAEGYTDDDRIRLMYEINDEYLEDEKFNLNKELDHEIIVFADLGLWYGRRSALKSVGTNLNDIFSNVCGDYVEWYVEDGEVKCKDTHHDGTNYYTYRVLKIPYEDFEEYLEDMRLKEAFDQFTDPIGHYVAEIYGRETENESV